MKKQIIAKKVVKVPAQDQILESLKRFNAHCSDPYSSFDMRTQKPVEFVAEGEVIKAIVTSHEEVYGKTHSKILLYPENKDQFPKKPGTILKIEVEYDRELRVGNMRVFEIETIFLIR